MMNKYYVYVHIRDGKIVYCGKGIKKILNCGKLYDRAYSNIDRKYNVKEVEVFKVKYFDTEQQALEYEEKLTEYFKSIGQCEYNIDIANKCGEEHRRKISENHADFSGENHPMFGRHHSEEARQKMSESKKGEYNPRSKAVIAFTDSGSYYKEFACARDAERELGITGSNICRCIKGGRKSAGKITVNGVIEKLRWKYKEDK